VIADHSFKFESFSPWDSGFPSSISKLQQVRVSNTSAYNPNTIKLPQFRKIIERPAPALFEIEDSREVSFSPFDERFPKSPVMKRKSRNHSKRNRRHLMMAMEQYKAEHGPMSSRPIKPASNPEKQMKSYSPWQEEQFAKACGIPAYKFIKPKNMRRMRPFSFSPWSENFPVFKSIPRQVSLPKMASMPERPIATPFPAFSPLHKRAKAAQRNSVTPSTSAMDMVESYEMMAGLLNTH
jgi:hypothetical protein